MNKNLRYPLIIVAVLALLGVGFYSGIYYGKQSIVCKTCKPEQVDFSLFWEAWDRVKARYVDPSKFDEQKMIYGAISGMIGSLGDPYTVFFSPEDNKKFMEEVSGSFEGVGMEVGIKKKQLQVVSPIEGTPAQKAGLRAGDLILKINKTDTSNLSVDEAVAQIRGPKGTEVTLNVYRDGWTTAKDIKVVRDKIVVPSIKMEIKEGDVAYLKIFQFSEAANADFIRSANEILKSPAKKIVLDLRNNPGGYLEVAQSMAGWFIEPGKLVVTEDLGQKGAKEEFKANGNAVFKDYPIVILINEGSASASEILSAAIRENNPKAVLVGQKSYGKGSVQEMEGLSNGSSLKITIAKWLTPNGNLIHEKGIEPDENVEITDKDYEANKDPQLEKALEIIKTKQ